jgi:hypothetical protein
VIDLLLSRFFRLMHRRASRYMPHQGKQECLRRVIGGWARSIREQGMTKNDVLQAIRSMKR